MTIKNQNNIVFFDGICVLCNSFANFLLFVDRKHRLQYSTLQGETARLNIKFQNLKFKETIVFIRSSDFYIKSDAVIEIFRTIGGVFSVFIVFYLCPKIIRDKLYDLVVRYRYFLFGKRKSCRNLKLEDRNAFLP